MFGGADRVLTLNARDSSNAVVNLAGLTLTWLVGKPPQNPDMRSAFLTYPGVIVSAPAGTFTAAMAAADTQDLHGNYLHQAIAVDGNGLTQVVSVGMLKIRRLMDH